MTDNTSIANGRLFDLNIEEILGMSKILCKFVFW